MRSNRLEYAAKQFGELKQVLQGGQRHVKKSTVKTTDAVKVIYTAFDGSRVETFHGAGSSRRELT